MQVELTYPDHQNGVTVVIVNYNAGEFLLRCIRSAVCQADTVIVVDNASTDASLTTCVDHFAHSPTVRFIRNDRNLGFAAACNVGYRATNSEHVLFLNPDCILAPNAVPALLEAIKTHPEAGIAGGLLLNTDGTEQSGGRRAFPTPWRAFVRAFGLNRFGTMWPRLFFDFQLHRQPLPTSPVPVDAVSGACLLASREAMDQVGPWDEQYFLHCEDLDLCMRYNQHGWKTLFVPTAMVTHALGISSRSRPIFVEWHKHRGMVRFYRKFFRRRFPGPAIWLVSAGVWLHFFFTTALSYARSMHRGFRSGGE